MISQTQDQATAVQFKKPQRKPISASNLVDIAPRPVGPTAILAIEARLGSLRLQDWARSNRELVENELMLHGTLLFRGFDSIGVEAFEAFARTLCSQLLRENGEHSRTNVVEGVYTPVFYAPEKKLLWHNENSFNLHWPSKIMFACIIPARQGGETPIADSRKIFQAIHPDVRDELMRKQVMYVRTYHRGLGLDWRTVFQAFSEQEVEQRCRDERVQCKWLDNQILQTRSVRPAAIRHPKTGEMSWFNQALHWHGRCLDSEVRSSLLATFSEEALPRNCLFGDGSRIDDAVIDHIREVYQSLESSFPWQQGDVMLVDNISVAHARNAYVGERKLHVAMGEMMSYDDVQHN